jgi:uncharacterized protein YhaN
VRLQHLQLIRYGKFTDAELTLPKADHDFHFIVGPNEAGKSTVRTAIAELLFGFPLRSGAMAFLHHQSDLRLGARVADGDRHLDLVRIKASKGTLRTPANAALPDDALAAFLGSADREFFEQMFGLDHVQLVRGGQSILDASKDVSQVLFQSAAGIAGLGKVKEALQAEAANLWAPRAASTRAYYVASARWEEACKELKALTVRTKVWTDARDQLAAVEARIEAATHEKKALQTGRTKLERVRRLAPTVQALRSKRAELAQLGDVLALPADASATLATAEATLSVAGTAQRQREQDVQHFKAQRDAAVHDAGLLAASDDIEALEAFAQRVRDHYADIQHQQGAFEKSLGLARAAAAELGWPQDESALRSKLPAALVLRDVQRLVTIHGEQLQAKATAAEAVAAKQAELDAATAELAQTAAGEVSSSLRGALADAQAYKNAAETRASLAAAVQAAQRAVDTALAGLGPWARPLDALQAMTLPSPARLVDLVTERHRLESAWNAASDRATGAQEELDAARLAVRQFTEARRIVTSAQVRDARSGRDAKWLSIKSGATPLAAGAAELDAAIALADELVDAQLGSATDAATLQGLQHRMERAALEHGQRHAAVSQKAADLAEFEQIWRDTASAIGLPGMALADAQVWFSRRDQALAAAVAHEDKVADLERQTQAADAVTSQLRGQLVQAGCAVAEATPLAPLLLEAASLIARTDDANTRRKLLARQIESAQTALRGLATASADANAAYASWAVAWHSAVDAAGLAAYVKSVPDAEQALAHVEAVRQHLDRAAATKRERIDTMQADLDVFDTMARALVARLGDTALAGAESRLVARTLLARLRETQALHLRRTTAEESLQTASAQLEEAKQEVERVKAKVAPLLAAAGVASLSEAAPLIERSDRKRTLAADVAEAHAALTRDSDGLGFDAVVAEVDACDLAQLPAELSQLAEALEQVQSQLTRLAEERLQAEQAFRAIGGSKDAASAESHRQEALADMADASERYIKVTTAVRLLTWAIDRYREQKQGPMLARAGAIFSTLTLGRYSRLFVDYEKTPLSLSALGSDGRQVEVSGMSEGTRDQLYLALRLAALELHLGKSKALPFVADDLFINFDDERSAAGLEALRALSTQTQVLFLSHHDHLLPRVRRVFGDAVNVVQLQR